MGRFVVLLRGVNVGGHNKVPMSEFRDLLRLLGHTNVASYLQSGNAVFTSGQRSAKTLAVGIERALVAELDVDVQALVLPQHRLQQIRDGNPMMTGERDPSHLHVAFLSGTPNKDAVGEIDQSPFAPDRFEVVGDVAYLDYPNGMGRSKLDPGKVFSRLGVWVTARNWRTVNALVDLAVSE